MGASGAGKSTLLRMINRLIGTSDGKCDAVDRRIGSKAARHLFQFESHDIP
ncbi:MAG: ATP-binding cassette domain-containing protein [Pseudomonadota bacterium]